jgi:predicted amidohydrolase YtcJ
VAPPDAASQADLVVVEPVVTMAASRPRAQALAVSGGKVAFVGDAPPARELLRPSGRLIELESGQAVVPGLVDAHVHMLDAGVMRRRCTLDEAKTKARALDLIAEYIRERPGLPAGARTVVAGRDDGDHPAPGGQEALLLWRSAVGGLVRRSSVT